MDTERRIQDIKDRLSYIRDIFGGKEGDHIRLLTAKLGEVLGREAANPGSVQGEELSRLEDLFDFSERKLDTLLTPMDRVRIVRHPQRMCLKD
ncbi:MAG: acetyl-CoA carboxylase carboxyl transferase subunit alpha/beta, partial [Proteobacteria bacterium]|nr:acetyl-CoA carboxylase carboxyl transferase subunit alpha/beta [Pseudomonadota bacterium]